MSRFRHVVMFRWEDTVDDADVAAITAGLATLPGLIPQIADYRFGSTPGSTRGTSISSWSPTSHSVDDYLVYRDHPDHRALIADLVTGHVATRAAVQYVIDG